MIRLRLSVLGLLLIALTASPLIASANALYVASLPTNTLYADDFENYPGTGNLFSCIGGVSVCSGATGSANGGGWVYYDSDTGGARNITTYGYYSCCKSLLLTSGTGVGGKVDAHRSIATYNTSRIIQLSVWFTFDNKTRNRNNQLTFSIESWDYVNKYECVANVYPQSANVGVASPDPTTLVSLRIAAFDDTRMVYSRGFWHHITMQCDIYNKKYVSLILDNWDLGIPGALIGARMTSTADTEMISASKPFTIPVRIEFANVNDAGTFTNPTDIYHKYIDDIIVTDVTPPPLGNIQLSLFNAALMLALFLPAALIGLSLKMFKIHPGQKIGTIGTETPKSYLKKALVLITIVALFALVALIVR